LFAALTITASPLALAYLAGEMGVLTLIATAIGAGWLLYRLDQGRRVVTQPTAAPIEANS
jgi:hypothetical protein